MAPGKTRPHGDAAGGAQSVIAGARKLKQQAERRPQGSPAREGLLKQAIAPFEAALKLPLSPADAENCLFDLAETYYLLAMDTVRASAFATSPLRKSITKDQARQLHTDAYISAASFFRRSFEAYEKVRLMKELSQEATINAANCLCDWADVLLELPSGHGGGIVPAQKLYLDAHARYSSALRLSPDDIETLTNFADCGIKRAELALQADSNLEIVMPIYEEALHAYNAACSLSDVRKGDDLPGILQNWAAGLVSKAKNVVDPREAFRLFDSAREKLQSATSFSPTDMNLLNALGELHISLCEKLNEAQTVEQSVVSNFLVEAVKWFKSALKVDAQNIDALLGLSEAYWLSAKMASFLGNAQLSLDQAEQSVDCYSKCVGLLREDTDGNCDMSFTQQCDVLYNFACSAAFCGREAVACPALQRLVEAGAVSSQELLTDGDLEVFKSKHWYLALVNAAAA